MLADPKKIRINDDTYFVSANAIAEITAILKKFKDGKVPVKETQEVAAQKPAENTPLNADTPPDKKKATKKKATNKKK